MQAKAAVGRETSAAQKHTQLWLIEQSIQKCCCADSGTLSCFRTARTPEKTHGVPPPPPFSGFLCDHSCGRSWGEGRACVPKRLVRSALSEAPARDTHKGETLRRARLGMRPRPSLRALSKDSLTHLPLPCVSFENGAAPNSGIKRSCHACRSEEPLTCPRHLLGHHPTSTSEGL